VYRKEAKDQEKIPITVGDEQRRIKEKEEHKVVLSSPVFPDVFQPSSLLAGFPRNKKYLGPKSKGKRN
jgi:hypothetical protein